MCKRLEIFQNKNSNKFAGLLPSCETKHVDQFFEKIEKNVIESLEKPEGFFDFSKKPHQDADKRPLPTWRFHFLKFFNSHKIFTISQCNRNELYLEFHRGTFTTQAAVKKGNRRCEFLMVDVEFLEVLSEVLKNSENNKKDNAKRIEKIQNLWEALLTQQFHDILPGSSIGMVYEGSKQFFFLRKNCNFSYSRF